jgi:hypothetical protein
VALDQVLTHGQRLVALDLAYTERPTAAHAAGLRRFLDAHPALLGGLLLHAGDVALPLEPRVLALPQRAVLP